MKRPVSVSVIAWLLIVMGVLSLIATVAMTNNPDAKALMLKNPLPIPIQYALSYFGLLVTISSGIGLLKGQNWARILYVLWSTIGFTIAVTTSTMKPALIPGLVVFLVIAILLFSKKTNAYFSNREEPVDA